MGDEKSFIEAERRRQIYTQGAAHYLIKFLVDSRKKPSDEILALGATELSDAERKTLDSPEPAALAIGTGGVTVTHLMSIGFASEKNKKIQINLTKLQEILSGTSVGQVGP